jgi:hypothetical protein
MDRDLTIMIYGAIMGVAGSLLTSIVSALFQFWLERREHERRQHEERRQARVLSRPLWAASLSIKPMIRC